MTTSSEHEVWPPKRTWNGTGFETRQIHSGDLHPGLVRLSIGLESLEDLLADLAAGLEAVAEAGFVQD